MTSQPAETAFTELLEQNYPRWFGIARAYAPGEGKDDLLQEIMLQVWKALPTFDEKSAIDTWAYRVALNTGLAWGRSRKNRNQRIQMEPADLNKLAGSRSSAQTERRILDEFLQSLSKIDRAVMLVHLDGMGDSQAAQITGLADGAFRVRLHRLKKKFQAAYCPTEATS